MDWRQTDVPKSRLHPNTGGIRCGERPSSLDSGRVERLADLYEAVLDSNPRREEQRVTEPAHAWPTEALVQHDIVLVHDLEPLDSRRQRRRVHSRVVRGRGGQLPGATGKLRRRVPRDGLLQRELDAEAVPLSIIAPSKEAPAGRDEGLRPHGELDVAVERTGELFTVLNSERSEREALATGAAETACISWLHSNERLVRLTERSHWTKAGYVRLRRRPGRLRCARSGVGALPAH